MSDDDADFFDTPRGNDSSKNYTRSCGGPSSSSQSQVRNGINSDIVSGVTDSSHSSKKVIVTKIPTGKYRKNSGSGSESEGSDTERGDKNYQTSKYKRGSRSRSRSYSSSGSSRSGSRSTSRSRSRSRSRSSESEDDKDTNNVSSKNVRKKENTVASRPKTGVSRRREQRYGEARNPPKNDDNHSDESSSCSSDESDSDMTDVSPLNSPHQATPKHSAKKVTIVESSQSERMANSPMHKDLVSYKVRPKSAHSGSYEHLLRGDKDSVNLKVLMEAILEMERDKEDDRLGRSSSKQFRVPRSNHSAPSIAGSVCSQSSVSSRTNMSFNNTRVRDIDRENQRLMKQILKFGNTKKKPVKQNRTPVSSQPKRVLTSAAVNRMREQERIERENSAMLKRLEGTSATKTLRRDVLDEALNTTTYVGVPLGVIHAPKSKPSRPRSAHSPYSQRSMSAGSRTRSMSQLGSDTCSIMSDATNQSDFSSSTFRSQRRPTSATKSKQRPKSAHVMNSGGRRPQPSRPAWEDGW